MKKGILIVAHPDDEILFFSSVIKKVEKIIVCFGPTRNKIVNEGRKQLVESNTFKNFIFLQIKESSSVEPDHWEFPRRTHFGMNVKKNEKEYRDNFDKIVGRLDDYITHNENIYTHNPWGEYGHEEHVQVFRAVEEIAEKKKCNIFVSGYVSDLSLNLAKLEVKNISNKPIFYDTPLELTKEYSEIYKQFNCWTWNNKYEWPKFEIFYEYKFQDEEKLNYITSLPPLLMLSWSRKPKKNHFIGRVLRRFNFLNFF